MMLFILRKIPTIKMDKKKCYSKLITKIFDSIEYDDDNKVYK